MGGKGGLIELVLVFAIVLGWGVLELRSTRLDQKKAEAKETKQGKAGRLATRPSPAHGRRKTVVFNTPIAACGTAP